MGCIASNERNFDIEPLPRNCSLNEWMMWKNRLLQIVNKDPKFKEELPWILAQKLKEVIGSYGDEIIKTFNNCDEVHLDVLLKKLELFFHLRQFPRDLPERESIEEYIQRLLKIALSLDSQNPSVAVKGKIAYDLKESNFFHQMTGLISIDHKIDYNVLNMTEIMFLVQTFDRREARSRREYYLKGLENNGIALRFNKNCCGLQHPRNNFCPATGQRCYKCHELNHFARTCNRLYLINCSNCGTNHSKNHCDAYGKQCSRCKEFNHFYWKCPHEWLNCCVKCGSSHFRLARCSSFGRRCSYCGKNGHFSRNCYSRRRR